MTNYQFFCQPHPDRLKRHPQKRARANGGFLILASIGRYVHLIFHLNHESMSSLTLSHGHFSVVVLAYTRGSTHTSIPSLTSLLQLILRTLINPTHGKSRSSTTLPTHSTRRVRRQFLQPVCFTLTSIDFITNSCLIRFRELSYPAGCPRRFR